MKWIPADEKLPSKDGKYWVYPYRTLGGQVMVTLAHFEKGKWEDVFLTQTYSHWQPLEIPKAPKNIKVEINHANYKKKSSDYLL
jgi:hypothetical protein